MIKHKKKEEKRLPFPAVNDMIWILVFVKFFQRYPQKKFFADINEVR